MSCRAGDSEVDVLEGSEVGASSRENLIEHLKELESGVYVDKITEEGGKLVGTLVKVLLEAQRTRSGRAA